MRPELTKLNMSMRAMKSTTCNLRTAYYPAVTITDSNLHILFCIRVGAHAPTAPEKIMLTDSRIDVCDHRCGAESA